MLQATPFNSPEEYRDCLSRSVGFRLRSDVPVGVCLSGGLDSSSILSLVLKDYDRKDINTFSAVYGKGENGDESEYINVFQDSVKNMHFTQPDVHTLLNDIPDFIYYHGEPVPSLGPYA